MLRFVLLLLLPFVQFTVQQQAGCLLDVGDLTQPPPIVLSGYTHLPLYPDIDNQDETLNILLHPGETLLVACPGGHLGLPSNPTSVLAQCNSNNEWIVNGNVTDLQWVTCDSSAPVSVNNTKKTCAPNAELLEIGYNVTGVVNQFIPVVKICFDFAKRNPVYSSFNLTKSIPLRVDYGDSYFTDDNYYNLSIPLYEIYEDLNHTRAVINAQVGLPENSTKYLDDYGVIQGFLILPDEFFYLTEQDAAARDVNTYPIWPGGCYNYDQTYELIYNYIEESQLDLEIYVGTWGVATLPHAQTGNPVEIYLYNDGNNTKAIPVPALTWRVLFHRASRRALALVTIDNDDDFIDVDKYLFCPDISQAIPWLTWSDCGRTFACSYYSFKAHVNVVPDLPVIDILI